MRVKWVVSWAIAVMLIAVVLFGPDESKDDSYSTVVECGDICLITNNPGGNVDQFLAAAERMVSGGKWLIVDGYCASACAVLADAARPNVCITRNARFYFHLARKYFLPLASIRPTVRARLGINSLWLMIPYGWIEPPHREDIKRWVLRHGGFPKVGVVDMSAEEASRFWPWCESLLIPRPRPSQ